MSTIHLFPSLQTRIGIDAILGDARDVMPHVVRTPLIHLPWLSNRDRNVWAKLECNQLTNSFKIRGAINAVRKLPAAQCVYTASAGNHGLAIAHVCKAMGHPCIVHVPTGASELKLQRLIQHGASVETVGRDLKEAMALAKARAIAANTAFISPFSDADVIRGHGTLALEVLEQISEPIDTVIVPLGGGGLVAGLAPVFKAYRQGLRIIAAHPDTFKRNLQCPDSLRFDTPVRPTLADGLAVQHDECDADLGQHILSLIDGFDMAREDEIAHAIAALLHNESVLAEGAGAIPLVPLLRDLDARQLQGNIVVIVSGGNIASATVMKCFMTQTQDARIATLLGHRSMRLSSETTHRAISQPASTNPSPPPLPQPDETFWNAMLRRLSQDFRTLRQQLEEHRRYTEQQNLDSPHHVFRHVQSSVDDVIEYLDAALLKPKSEATRRALYRLMLQQFGLWSTCLSWRSPSHDQSRCVMFFDPQENGSSSANYDRYGSAALRKKELQLLDCLGFSSHSNDLLLVSSGQAAYSVIESFLMAEALPPGTVVLTSPYIYFEAHEQLRRLPHIELRHAPSWELDAIVDLIEQSNARVVFLDPLANLGTMQSIDLHALAKKISGRDWSDRWLVIDGTMVSGGLNVFAIFDRPEHPQILYYESGSKYLQLGLDLQMAGIVACQKQWYEKLAVARRNLGAVLYHAAVNRFPSYDRALFLSRMQVLTRNARTLCQCLCADVRLRAHIEVAFPQDWQKLGWAHGGGVVAIRMRAAGLNNFSCLDAFIEHLLATCRKANVAMTKGVSFGFATTRVSAAAAMAADTPPFLRFSVGEETPLEMDTLSQVVTQSLIEFLSIDELSLV